MNTYAKLAVAAVLVVVVGAAGLALFRPGDASGPGGAIPPSPTPSIAPSASPAASAAASATPALTDTSNWVPFTSARYGYQIGHPPGWTATPASRAWTMAVDAKDWTSPAQDEFIDKAASYEIGVHGFSAVIPKGTSVDQWIESYAHAAAGPCNVVPSALPAVTVDAHVGKFADQPACSDSIAFVPVDGRMFVFTIGREQQVPLLDAFLSTVRFPTASPSASN